MSAREYLKENEVTKKRLIDLRNKVKETDKARKEAINQYKRALYAYDAMDEEVLKWDEERRNHVTKGRRLRRRVKT